MRLIRGVSSQYPGANGLLNGLIAHWSLNETSGNRTDSVNSYVLTDNNTVTYDTGKLGNAAKFVAADSEFLSLDQSAFNPGTGSLSIAFWAKLSADIPIICKGNQATSNTAGWRIFTFSTNFGIRASSGSANSQRFASKNVTDGNWHLCVAVINRTDDRMDIYADGANKVGGALTSSWNITSADSLLVGLANTTYFNGLIDELAFWNRPLTDADAAALYNSGTGLTKSQYTL